MVLIRVISVASVVNHLESKKYAISSRLCKTSLLDIILG